MNTVGQKIGAILCCGTLLFGFVLLDFSRWRGIGRAGYLQYQLDRFDRYIAEPGAQLTFTFIGALMAAAVLVGAYELILFALRKAAAKQASR